MKYLLNKLSNGLPILTVPMPSSESVTITVWVNTGSRREEFEKLGISHYLEHMVFKGSSKYPTMKQLFEAFDEMGAEHNAGTSKEWTNFWVKLPVSDVERGFDILSDVVLKPNLDAEEAKRERTVIFEEMKMINDMPMRHIGDVFEELIYQESPLSWEIIGTTESMNKITRQDFLDYRQKYYFAENMLITIAGGVTESQIVKLSNKYFEKLDNKPNALKISPFKGVQTKPQFKLQTKDTDQAHLILGFLAEGRRYKNKYAQSVLSTILGGGASSRLWTEVREKRGLAYAVSGSMDRYSDTGYFGVYVGCDPAKAQEAISVILDQCYGIASKKYPITDHEFKKVKGFIKGHIALSLEESENINDFFAEQYLFDEKINTPEELFKKVDDVTLKEVYLEAEKLFKPEKLNLAVIGPFKNREEFDKIIK